MAPYSYFQVTNLGGDKEHLQKGKKHGLMNETEFI